MLVEMLKPMWAPIAEEMSIEMLVIQGLIVTQAFLPYMVGLNLPHLNQLINVPLQHDPNWPHMPTNLSSYTPKFEGNSREDTSNHIQSFHKWHSPSSIMEDFIHP